MSDTEARRLRRAGAGLPPALVDPHPDRLPAGCVADVLRAHREAVEAGADGYVDPVTGMFSFTASFHWEKGICCDLGCRHCPWLDADTRMGTDGP